MKRQKRYFFNQINYCNMCGSPAEKHTILGRRLNNSQGLRPCKKIGISTTIIQCINCRLIYTNPQPVPFDLQDHYGVPPENYWKENYFSLNEDYFKHEIQILNQLCKLGSIKRSLDIGAGLGKQMIALSNQGIEAFGFEPSEPFYERAITKMGIRSSHLKLGTIEEVEYPTDFFDFISFGAVLEHLYNPSDSIIKALRWLKPSGIIHIEVPSSNWLIGDFFNLYYRLIGTDYVGNLSPMHEPFHLYEFSLKSFQEHAVKHGYKVEHHEYYVCETYLPKMLDIILKPIMQKTKKGMQLCVWLRKN